MDRDSEQFRISPEHLRAAWDGNTDKAAQASCNLTLANEN